MPEPSGRTWRHEDFEKVGLANIDSLRGGTIVAGAILLVGIIFLFTVVWLPGGYDLNELYNNPEFQQLVYVLMLLLLLGLIGSIEITRRAVGKLVEAYVRTTDRILTGRRRS